MITSDQHEMALRAIAEDICNRYNPTYTGKPGESEYDIACERYGRAYNAATDLARIGEMLKEMGNDGYEIAIANLRQYEESPGIPKQEYR